MSTDGGPRAWAFLRRNPVYRADWSKVGESPLFESAPFPVCIQSAVDLQARAWGLLAWEDPDGSKGASSPFWAEAPMLEAEWSTGPPPLARLVADAGGLLAGLRLADGALVLKIENRSGVAQLRMLPGAGIESGAGVAVRIGVGQPEAVARLKDLGSLLGGTEPRRRSGEDRELLSVLDGRLAGKSWRETAVDLYGTDRVASNWHPDSWMRARVRRRGRKARELMERGYRVLAAGR